LLVRCEHEKRTGFKKDAMFSAQATEQIMVALKAWGGVALGMGRSVVHQVGLVRNVCSTSKWKS
jgi:hypothetical protein